MVGCEATSCGDLHSVMLEYTKDARFVKSLFTFPPKCVYTIQNGCLFLRQLLIGKHSYVLEVAVNCMHVKMLFV